tara:strand:- start:570 stop:929 length:360 start_codon:yes stop_codon:yes gene_type:complete
VIEINTALGLFIFIISLNYHDLTKQDCMGGNWSKVGKKDASLGFKSNRINHHIETCLKYKIKPDTVQYAKGRLEGLKLFCTKEKGYHWGRANRENPNICPDTTSKLFLKGHRRGKRARN